MIFYTLDHCHTSFTQNFAFEVLEKMRVNYVMKFHTCRTVVSLCFGTNDSVFWPLHYRYRHHGVTHISKTIPPNASKHGPVPSGSSGIMGKPRPGENRHESYNRRSGILDAKLEPVQPYQSMKREPKPDLITIKKEDSMDFSSRVGGSSAPQPPPPPLLPPTPPTTKPPPPTPTLPLPTPQKQQSPPPAAAQPLLLPDAVILPSLHHPQERQKYRPRSPSRSKKTPTVLSDVSTPVSPFGSPPPPNPTTPGNASRLQGLLRSRKRHRTSSSSSKLVLVPVVKKLDEIAGYENIIHDSKMGIKVPNRVPDIIPTIRDRNKKDGTNVAVSVSEDHHKSEKKKRKKEHKEHKRKDNYRNQEERKHKHIHKDKDKDGHKGEKAESSAPIKITIPKDKISLGSTLKPVAGTGPVIKVHRRRPIICTDSAGMYTYAGPSRELIVKSLKEIKSNFSNSMTGPSGSNSETPSSSRKRDRSSPQSSELVPPLGPPAKAARFSTS